MSHVVILGVFVADTAYRADRMPVMGETVLGNSFSLGPGGKGSNQAVAAGRLGVKVSMISRLGKDDFGQMAIDTWKSSGVTPYIEEDVSSYTGAAFIFIEENSGDNAIIISPGAAANISPKDLEKRKDFYLLSGDDPSFVEFGKYGAVGIISVAANIVPEVIKQISDLIQEKNFEEAALISKKYEKLFNILLENSPGPSKYLLAKIKMLENNLRLPLVRIPEKLEKEIDETYSNT